MSWIIGQRAFLQEGNHLVVGIPICNRREFEVENVAVRDPVLQSAAPYSSARDKINDVTSCESKKHYSQGNRLRAMAECLLNFNLKTIYRCLFQFASLKTLAVF